MSSYPQQPPLPQNVYYTDQQNPQQGYYPNQPIQQPQPGYYPNQPIQQPQPGYYPGQPVQQPTYQDTNMQDFNNYQDDEVGDPNNQFGDGFSEKAVRRMFIRKVYSILMVQLAITAGLMALLMFSPGAKEMINRNVWLVYVAMALSFVLMIVLSCCTQYRRKFPVNFILLFLFTVVEGFLLGFISSHYEVEEVLIAVGITAAVCLGLTLFAFQTKYDLTAKSGTLLVLLIVLLLFGLFSALWGGRTARLIYACLGVLVFSLYLVFDTQLMMGGKHKYAISPEDYIFAALNLYVDIINLFLFILSIVGDKK